MHLICQYPGIRNGGPRSWTRYLSCKTKNRYFEELYKKETRNVLNTKEERTWSKVLNMKSLWRGKTNDKCSTSKTTPNKKWYKNAKIWKFETDQLEAKNTRHSRERHFKIKHVNVNTVFSKRRAKLKPLVTKTIPVMVNTTYVEALYLKSYFFSNLCYLLLYYPFILLKPPPPRKKGCKFDSASHYTSQNLLLVGKVI